MQEKKGHYKLNHNIVGSICILQQKFTHIIRKALLTNQVGKLLPQFRLQAQVEQYNQSIEHFSRIWCYLPKKMSLGLRLGRPIYRSENREKQLKSRYFHESYDMTPYLDMDS